MEQTNNTAPQGKGMAVTGFVIALVAIVGWFIVSGIAVLAAAATGGGMGLAITWLIISLLSAVLSVMGMMKLGKTGGKKGLAIAGLVIGAVATIMSVTTVLAVKKAAAVGDQFKDSFGAEMQKLQDEAAKAADTTMNAQ
jgi:hypothetical protein